MAAILAGCSTLVGHRLKLDTSARLFVVTFLLVTFSGDSGEAAQFTAAIRVVGIVLGVLVMLLVSVIVLPKSATVQCLHRVDDALLCLHEVHSIVWRDYALTPTLSTLGALTSYRSSLMPPGLSNISSQCSSPRDTTPLLSNGQPDEETRIILLAAGSAAGTNETDPSSTEHRSDAALTGVYSALFGLEEDMKAAKSEILLGTFFGRILLIPGLPLGRELRHLPVEALLEAGRAIRRAAKVSSALGEALEASRQASVMQRVPSSNVLLEAIARAGHAVIAEARQAFPSSPSIVKPTTMLCLLNAIKAWETAAGQAVYVQLQKLHWYRDSSVAWEELERSVTSRVPLPILSTTTPPQRSAGEGERTLLPSPFADVIESDQGGCVPGASSEWQMLTFVLRQLGISLATMQEQLSIVMDLLPDLGNSD